MESAIGIRVSPKEIYYTIFKYDEQRNLDYFNESLIIPKALIFQESYPIFEQRYTR